MEISMKIPMKEWTGFVIMSLRLCRPTSPEQLGYLPLLVGHCRPGWRLAPLAVVEQGRGSVGDEIGEALGVQLSVVFIGARPCCNSLGSPGGEHYPDLGNDDYK
jgi:hypothetical protein